MKLEFKKLTVSNFMAFENEVFEFDKHIGMNLVCGKNNDLPNTKNGAGKSCLFSALLYVLFGQPQIKLKNEHIINRYTGIKDTSVSITFSSNDKNFSLTRGISKGKNSYLELFEDDINITKSTIQETQNFIEKELLSCDISIFMRTILLMSDDTYNFYKMKASDKKDFVEKLFDISVFGDMYSLIHKEVLNLDKKILAAQNRLIVLSKSKADYNNMSVKYENDRKSKLKILAESLISAKKQLENDTSETKNTEDEIKKLEDAVVKINNAELDLSSESADLNDKIKKSNTAIEILTNKIDTRKSFLSKHTDLYNKLCGDCKTIYSEYHKINQYENEIKELTEKTEKLSEKNKELINNYNNCIDKLKKLKDKKSNIDLTLTKIKSNRDNIIRLKNAAEIRISSFESDVAKIKTEKNPYLDLITKNEDDVKTETSAMTSLENNYAHLKYAETIVSQETLRKLIISDLIGLLNNKIKTYLTKMGSIYTVIFDSDMNYEFITDGGSCEFGNFSAGERMRIMIATSFAFRDFMSIRNGLSSNILILDEYFDSAIDSACIENILSILREYSNTYNQNIYLVSHRYEVADDQFSNIIQIEKTKNISKIKYIS